MKPEQKARDQIDLLLEAAGWKVQDLEQLNLGASIGIAVREFPLKSGPADYLLFIHRKAVGVVEAKPQGTTLSGAAEQSQAYLSGIPDNLQYVQLPLPFAYETTGIETFFRDLRDPDTRSRRVFSFHRPETLLEWLSQSDTLCSRLRNIAEMSPLTEKSLRNCQVEAIRNLEKSFAVSRPRALIQTEDSDILVLSFDQSQINPTIRRLKVIRSRIAMLLSEKPIKQILPVSLESLSNINDLFTQMVKRIQSGATPRYFIKIYNLFYKWKYYSIFSVHDSDVVNDVLQYHFMRLEDKNDLYECWIFCKILYALSHAYDLKFVEVNSSPVRAGIASFRSNDGSLEITYQPVYITDWEDKFSQSMRPSTSLPYFLRDIPDISIYIPANNTTIIIDAKNSLIKRNSKPNVDQMRSYMDTTKAKHGIFVHSDSEDQDLFESIHHTRTNQQIIWTSLVPDSKESKNDRVVKYVVEIVKKTVH